MSQIVNRAAVSALVTAYNNIRNSVTFTQGAPGGTGTLPVNTINLNNPIPEKVTLDSIKAGIDDLFSKFSNNCNCAVNTDCNQTCQITTCQTQCTPTGNQSECNAMSNQGCQTTTCQSECTISNQGCETIVNQANCTSTNQANQSAQCANQSNQTNQAQCSNCNCNCST